MMKKVILLLAVLLLILGAAPSAFAETHPGDPVLMDRADLLTDEEETLVESSILHFIEEKNCHLLVFTDTIFYDSNYDLSPILNRLQSRDLIVLTVTHTGGLYYYDLFTYEEADRALSTWEVNAILDAEGVFGNLKGGRICDGLLAFVEETSLHLDPVVDPPEGFYLTRDTVLIALGVSLAVALLCCGIVVARYKLKLKPTNYPLEHYTTLNLTEKTDVFLGSAVTKRRISSSSGGGSSGGRSGGHRGGR